MIFNKEPQLYAYSVQKEDLPSSPPQLNGHTFPCDIKNPLKITLVALLLLFHVARITLICDNINHVDYSRSLES